MIICTKLERDHARKFSSEATLEESCGATLVNLIQPTLRPAMNWILSEFGALGNEI